MLERQPSGRARPLQEAVETKMMEQLIDFPTQVSGNTLDIILTDIPEQVVNIEQGGQLGSSDHVIILRL